MATSSIFTDPRYVHIQKELAETQAPKVAESLGNLLKRLMVPQGGEVMDVGAGMGHLAFLLQKADYKVSVLEREKRYAQELQQLFSEFYDHLMSQERLFVRDVAEHKFTPNSYDAIYMNEGPLLIVRLVNEQNGNAEGNSGVYVVESYLSEPGDKTTSLEEDVLLGMGLGLKGNAPLIISIQNIPEGSHNSVYNGKPVDYSFSSAYDLGNCTVLRTRKLTGGGLEPIKDPPNKQRKLIISLDEFKHLANKADLAFPDYVRGDWYVMRKKLYK